ncbi:MAG: hypothetical protein ACLQHT_22115 [Terracidiphilus sp.]|jgi:hypothetical protein
MKRRPITQRDVLIGDHEHHEVEVAGENTFLNQLGAVAEVGALKTCLGDFAE